MDLRRLLHPRGIAVFGGWQAAGVIRRCEEMGFAGPIWPVHPTRTEIEGRPAFRSVADLPETPDAAFIAVNRELSVEVVRELAARGAGGAVCYASGFKETGGRGEELQAALVAAAGDMPFFGPNCYGIINYLDGALLWFDQHGGKRCERGVAILTQSGNIALNLTMQRRGLPLAYVLTLGNQAKVGLATCLAALVDDPRVTAIGLHIEGIDDVAAFDAAGRKALAARKPVVVLKAGRSAAGAALTMSHTASLAGADEAMTALFARLGMARVNSIPVLLETLKLLHAGGALHGRDVVSLSCSGGEASLMADASEGRRLCFRGFDPDQTERVRTTLNELVTISNPLDYHTFIWAKPDQLRATFSAVMACGFDLSFLLLDLPRADRCDPADWYVSLDAWKDARDATGARTAILATLPECLPEHVAERLLADGIAPLAGMEEALAAAEAAADIGAAQARALPPPLLSAEAPAGEPVTLDEWEGKTLLARFGLAHPGGRCVPDAAAAVAAAEAMGYPVVVKAVGRTLAHKSELGAVALRLRNAAEVEAVARRMLALGEAILVEPMVQDGVAELLVGVIRDPQLGLCLVVGAGGIMVELLADRALLLLPTTEEAVREAISSLRTAPLLQGFRGRPAGDLDAAVAAVLAVARFAATYADRLVELDVNPLIVRPAGKGAVAADAFVRLVPGEPSP
ncbi:acetate--CoA ligase family protein [Benzoatithermus flavus]|uniref:Acetate--CoA ligase family protein n=1 Tax=Benzoatithermus flavus TaxID=3108223 RepID=A0ABU8XSF7_9PROT